MTDEDGAMTAEPARATDEPASSQSAAGQPAARARDDQPQEEAHFFKRLHTRLHRNPVTSLATKVVVTCLGVAVIAAGFVMMVTPGPGIVAIVVGLGLLATEWDWAERWVHAARAKAHEAAERARAVDPAVRRRRIALIALAVVVVAGAVIGYLAVYDWPVLAVDGWDWIQDLSSMVPELPGM